MISPVDSKIEVPMIEKRTGQVIALMADTVQLMDMETYQTFETPTPVEEDLRSKLSSGVEVEYWSMMGRNKIVRTKG